MIDRRKARRYDLALPVTIHASISDNLKYLYGVTLDISPHGVYFTAKNDLKAGMKLGLSMRVQTGLIGGAQAFILAIGRVVRVEKLLENGIQKVGIAAAIKHVEYFRDGILDDSSESLSSLAKSFGQ